ncbi:hypothetical protein BD309DRAFT_975940 [Dichomitus squalens]|nr:hypothetical protein BD309DRAFT_975940 [Dichomitus squalens]
MPCATVLAASLSTACFPTSSSRTPPTSVKTSDDRILPPPSEEAVDMVFREVLKLFKPMPGATLGDMREQSRRSPTITQRDPDGDPPHAPSPRPLAPASQARAREVLT